MDWNAELQRCTTPSEALEVAEKIPLIALALSRLEKETTPELTYHNLEHTLDVMSEVALFAMHDGVDAGDLLLLLIAAAWHDCGFTRSREDHEEVGVALFQEAIQQNPELLIVNRSQQVIVEQMILDTKLYPSRTGPGVEQIPNTKLSKYLLDADLSNLGRDDFFESMERVRLEHDSAQKEFFIRTLGLITRHKWHTRVAQDLRTKKELENNLELVRMIKETPDDP